MRSRVLPALLLVASPLAFAQESPQGSEYLAGSTYLQVKHYSPYSNSRKISEFSLQGAWSLEDLEGVYTRVALQPMSSNGPLKYGSISFGVEWRTDKDFSRYISLSFGAELKLERYKQTGENIFSVLEGNQITYSPGFNNKMLRPAATFGAQIPGLFWYLPAKGRIQPITRVFASYTLISPSGKGQEGAFLRNINPIQAGLAIGLSIK
jgi:hypothetical protein